MRNVGLECKVSSPLSRVLVVAVTRRLHASRPHPRAVARSSRSISDLSSKRRRNGVSVWGCGGMGSVCGVVEEWGQCVGLFLLKGYWLELERNLIFPCQVWPYCCFTSTQREMNRGTSSTKHSGDLRGDRTSLRAKELIHRGFFSRSHQLAPPKLCADSFLSCSRCACVY